MSHMPRHAPLWGSFLFHADFDVMAFGWLLSGKLTDQALYHAIQAIEKYLKTLALTIVDPEGDVATAKTKK
jgi:hypothetical protein